MRKILKTIFIIGIASFLFTSCKKEKTKTTAEQIVGVWHIKTYLYNEHIDGSDHIEQDTASQSDTYEFKADGTINANINNSIGSSTYTILDDNKVSITDDETYDIKKLDDHNLVLYVKLDDGDDYEEMTITFSR